VVPELVRRAHWWSVFVLSICRAPFLFKRNGWLWPTQRLGIAISVFGLLKELTGGYYF
jgi:hypothetical protein